MNRPKRIAPYTDEPLGWMGLLFLIVLLAFLLAIFGF